MTYQVPKPGRIRYQVYGKSSECLGRVVVAYLHQDDQLFLGVAFCSPKDIFDELEGRQRASQRLRNAPVILPFVKQFGNIQYDILSFVYEVLKVVPNGFSEIHWFDSPVLFRTKQSPNWITPNHLPRWGRKFSDYLDTIRRKE